jgi:diacylglycerol O-acyltransferase
MPIDRILPATEALNGVDCAWLRLDTPSNAMTITGIMWFEDPIAFEDYRRVINERWVPFRRFRQRVVRPGGLARPHWELADDFDIDDHVKRITLPPGQDLRELVAKLVNGNLDYSKPLWDMHLVEGLEQGNAVITRIHHSLADGFSLVTLMLSLVDDGCEVELPTGPPPPKLDPNADLPPVGSIVARLGHHAKSAIDSMVRMVSDTQTLGWLGAGAPRTAQTIYNLLTMPPDTPTSLRGPLSGLKRVGWSNQKPLAELKEIARAYGGTVNDLLLMALTGAFRRVLLERGEDLTDGNLRVVVPVNLRPMEFRTAKLGNGFGLIWVELPVGVDNRKERFGLIKRRMDRIKRSPEAFVAYGALRGAGLCPDAVQQWLVDRFFVDRNTAVVTNVPGPLRPLLFGGKAITNTIFWVPQSAEVGLGVSIFSYNEHIQIGVMADKNLMEDPCELVGAFNDELEHLRDADAD